MIEFVKYQQRNLFLFLLWMITGYININLGVVVISLTSLLLFVKRFEIELLLGLFLMLILSDNYYLHYPGIVKPVLLSLLFLYVLFNSSLLRDGFLARSFIPFFVYTIALWPLSDYLAISVQKNLAYIFLYVAIPPLFVHLFKNNGNQVIRHLIYFVLLILIFNLTYRIIQPELALSHGGRLRGFFGNPNGLGMFCFFSLMLFELARQYFRISFSKSINWTFYIVCLALLFLTASRASIFASLIFYSVLFLARFSLILALTSVLVFSLSFQFLVDPLLQLLIDAGFGEILRLTTEGAESIEAGSGRLIAWNFAWEQIQLNFFFGKAWAHEEELFHTPGIQTFLNSLNHEGGAHNVYLIFWMNTGLVGLTLFFTPLISIFLQAMKKSELALPVLVSCLFLAFFEPWLAAAMNPYTIILLIILTSLIYCRPLLNEEST